MTLYEFITECGLFLDYDHKTVIYFYDESKDEYVEIFFATIGELPLEILTLTFLQLFIVCDTPDICYFAVELNDDEE